MLDVRSTVRFAIRFLRARPLFTLVSVASLALGIGATTAIFSVVNALLIRTPPGLGEPERVVEFGRTENGHGFDTFSYPDLVDYREQVEPLEELAAWTLAEMSWSTEDDAERVLGLVVSTNYFDALGVTPARGRGFLPEEGAEHGPHPVAIVSDRFWRERLGGDEDVLGSTIWLNRTPMTVIGVTPPEFRGHMALIEPSVYLPLSMESAAFPGRSEDLTNRNSHWLLAIGRLAESATVEEAAAAADLVASRIEARFPDVHPGEGAGVVSLGMVPGAGRGLVTGLLVAILALVGVVLLVTCTNTAGMLLARGAAREKEIGIRLALGSSRGRLIGELLAESLTLFVLGGVAGIALAAGLIRVLEGVSLPTPIPVALHFAPDLRVLGFGLGVALLTGVAFGLAPAFLTTRLDLVPALKASSGSGRTRGSRLQRVFVTGQVAMSVVLLFGSGLFLRALWRASSTDVGFDPDRVQLTSLGLALDGYDEERGVVLERSLLDAARALPGVEAAGLALDLPLDLASHGSPVYPEEWSGAPEERERGLGSDFNVVSAGYFETLRIPVLRGRGFLPSDRDAAEPVAVVTRALAERVWPDGDPIGHRVRFGGESAELRTVVGVVEDTPNQVVTDRPDPMIYLPLEQRYESSVTLVVRGATDASLAGPIRAAVRELDPRLTLTPIVPLESRTSLGVLPQRVAAGATTALAVLALLLSALGVHGVLAYAVAQRTREIGIRLAVGARARQVGWLMLRQGLRLAVPGVLVGVPLALAVGRLLGSFLLGGSVLDPITLAVVAVVLLAATMTASWLPARRAARVDPIRALRVD